MTILTFLFTLVLMSTYFLFLLQFSLVSKPDRSPNLDLVDLNGLTKSITRYSHVVLLAPDLYRFLFIISCIRLYFLLRSRCGWEACVGLWRSRSRVNKSPIIHQIFRSPFSLPKLVFIFFSLLHCILSCVFFSNPFFEMPKAFLFLLQILTSSPFQSIPNLSVLNGYDSYLSLELQVVYLFPNRAEMVYNESKPNDEDQRLESVYILEQFKGN